MLTTCVFIQKFGNRKTKKLYLAQEKFLVRITQQYELAGVLKF